MRPRSGLAWRVMALFVAFAVALLIIVGLLLTVMSFRAQRAAVTQTQAEIAKRAARDVSGFVSSVEQSLHVLAETRSLADLEPAEQRQALNQLLDTLPAFDELAYIDARGRERAKVSPYHTFTANELQDRSTTAGFRSAIRGERYLGDVRFSSYSGQPIVSLAMPVADLRQANVGVLAAQVNFHQMWSIVTGMEVGDSGYAYVVDEQGRLIAYRDISPILRQEDLSDLPTVAAFLGGRPASAEYLGLAGERVVGAQAPIDGTPWAIIAERPTGEAYAGLYRMLGLLGLLLLAAIAVAAGTGRYLAGYIVRPIRALQTGAAVIGGGDLEHTIELHTGDEIEALAEAFNAMSRNLRRSRAEIERWNRELEALVGQRTAALEALIRVSQRINAALALPDALEAVAEASRTVLGAGRCAVYLLDTETGQLNCVLSQGLSPDYVSIVQKFFRQIPAGQVIDRRRPLVIPDAANDPSLAAIRDSIRQEGYRSVALLPLVHGDESLGMLSFYHETEREYSPQDLELAQTFANQAAIAIKNARLFDAVSERAAELSALYAVATTVSQTLELDDVLNSALDEVLALMRTEVGWIYLVDEEMDGLILSAYHGPDAVRAPNLQRLQFGEGFSGYVAQSGQPVLVKDAENTSLADPHPAATDEGLRSFAGVPLQSKGQILGVLCVASFGDRQFTQQETALLSSTGRQIGIAVENARLYDQSREVAALEERNRLAREMHDTLAQGLTGIVVQLEAAERVAARRPDQAAASLERAKTLARRSLEDARRSLWNLRPTPLEDLTLSAALQQAAQRLGARNGFDVHFRISGQQRSLARDDELNLFRIVREALANVEKHARASQVDVAIAYHADSLRLVVADDGVGGAAVPVVPGRNGGLGLIGMRERAHLLGGSFEIDSPLHGGTTITVKVPK